MSLWLLIIFNFVFLNSCSRGPSATEELQREGNITYPFFGDDKPLGINAKKEKFVIRTEDPKGRTYILEIPGAGDDYGIEIPIQDIDFEQNKNREIAHSLATDQEIAGPPVQNLEEPAPSYTVKMASIKDFFKKGDMDRALIEINYLLQFWPTKVELMKMKATVLEKLGYLDQAKKTLETAFPLSHGEDKIAIEQKLSVIRQKLGL